MAPSRDDCLNTQRRAGEAGVPARKSERVVTCEQSHNSGH